MKSNVLMARPSGNNYDYSHDHSHHAHHGDHTVIGDVTVKVPRLSFKESRSVVHRSHDLCIDNDTNNVDVFPNASPSRYVERGGRSN